MIRAKVEAGEYATESEVIRDGLRVLLARELDLDIWLKEQVAPAYDALMAGPQRSISPSDVRAALKAEHSKAISSQ